MSDRCSWRALGRRNSAYPTLIACYLQQPARGSYRSQLALHRAERRVGEKDLCLKRNIERRHNEQNLILRK